MIDQRGIFLTFMVFLLGSTVMILSFSLEQTEIEKDAIVAEESAFRETNNRFNNIRNQISVTKEGYAGSAYGRFMPFKKFRAGRDWIEIEQKVPLAPVYQENTYDAINLFNIFMHEKGGDGMEITTSAIAQNSNWDGSDSVIEYVVLPQCMKFWVNETGDTVEFGPGLDAADNCEADFDGMASIGSYEILVDVDSTNLPGLGCSGDFTACDDLGDDLSDKYAKITFRFDGVEEACTATLQDCSKVVSTNLTGTADSYVEIQYSGGETTRLEFGSSDYLLQVIKEAAAVEEETIKSKISFTRPVSEVVLGAGSFDFSVKKPGFDWCRATNETGCGT